MHGGCDERTMNVAAGPRLAVGGVVGMKQQLNATVFLLTIEFIVAIVMTDQCTAANCLDIEYAKVTGGSVMDQITGGAEHLVVAINDSAAIVDHIEAVMRLVTPGQPM
mgnify:CR=1 FL=1